MKKFRPILKTFLLALAVPSLCYTEISWPDYRGPRHDGSANNISLPTSWSEEENIVWKTAIHGRGWSSPVVADAQIWLTTATPDGKDLFAICVDGNSGKILLDKKLFHIPQPQFAHRFNSYASPSPQIDGDFVYISFGSPGTACVNRKTSKILWQRTDFICDHFRGAGSSPFVYKNLVILTMDGADHQFLVALDKMSGKTVWRTDRSTDFGDLDPNTGKPKRGGDLRKSYATPVVAKIDGRDQLISPGAKAVFAYEPLTGKEIWTVRYENHSSASRTVLHQGMALIGTGYSKAEMLCIKLGGKGDISKTHLSWKLRKGAPNKPSPVIHGQFLYTVTDGGIASCIKTQTGKVLWQHRLGGEYSASLLLSTDNVYCFDQEGTCTIFAASPKGCSIISRCKLSSGFMASPGVLKSDLILRSKTHLYRISKQGGK